MFMYAFLHKTKKNMCVSYVFFRSAPEGIHERHCTCILKIQSDFEKKSTHKLKTETNIKFNLFNF